MGIVNTDYRAYQNAVNKIFSEEILEFRLMERQDYLELFSIAIKPEHRNRGLGSSIILDTIIFARENGYKGIQLQMDHKDRDKLQPFYESLGFKSIDEELTDFMRIDFKE